MTTIRDGIDNRRSDESWGEQREFTQGVPADGFADATGEFPKRDYFFSSSINQSATGQKINNLWVGGSVFNVNFDITEQNPSTFPYSQVRETPSGHIIEIDDTPGSERILIKHRSGSGVELKPNGSMILSSRSSRIDTVSGEQKLIVSGSGDIVYEGNLNIKVTGDYNVDVGGNYNVSVAASKLENVSGSRRILVGETSSHITQGDRDNRTNGNLTDLSLGEYNQIIKNNHNLIIGGSFKANSNEEMVFGTKTNLSLSAINLSGVGKNINMVGETGLIGGSQVEHHGMTYTGPLNGTGEGVTFYGSLVGRALEAYTSKYAKFSEYAYEADYAAGAGVAPAEAGSADGASEPPHSPAPVPNYDWSIGYNVNSVSKFTPDSTLVDMYLKTKGTKNILVDNDDLISNKISAKQRYFGFFNKTPSLEQIRSKFRSFSRPGKFTEEETKCIDVLLSESRIGYKFAAPILPDLKIGRSCSIDPSFRLGNTLLGNPMENRSKKFSPNKFPGLMKKMLPDPKYNPDTNKKRITSNTNLAPGVCVGKFFGAEGSGSSMIHAPIEPKERSDLFRHLYLHAQIISQFEKHPDFKDHKLIVSESFYNKSASEDTTNRFSVNEHKIRGRAVVYKVVDSRGTIDFAKTYDLAFYWKDHIDFDKMILDYDTYHPLNLLSAQIILIMPEMTQNFESSFAYKTVTHTNGFVYSPNEIVELSPK